MSTAVAEQRLWPKWFQPQPSKRQSVPYHNYRSTLVESPPTELPELVYPTPSDISSPSCSSSSHVHLVLNTPSLSSHEYDPQTAQPVALVSPQKRTPNKLRKLSLRKSSIMITEPLELPTDTFQSSAPGSLRQYDETYHPAASNSGLYLYRSTSTPTVGGASSSLSTERATIYSRSSQVPLIPGTNANRSTTWRNSMLSVPSPTRKLTKPRPVLSTISSYTVLEDATRSEDLHYVSSATVPSEDGPKRSSSISLGFRKRWRSQTQPAGSRFTGKLVKKQSQTSSYEQTFLPAIPPFSPLVLDEHVSSPSTILTGTMSTPPLRSFSMSGISEHFVPPRYSLYGHEESWSPYHHENLSASLEGNSASRVENPEAMPSSPVRPALVRQNAFSPVDYEGLVRPRPRSTIAQASVHRRWTLAMAMTDDGMTDEIFIQELERLRQEWDGNSSDSENESDSQQLRVNTTRRQSMVTSPFHFEFGDDRPSKPRRALSQSAEDVNWPSALRALLITRDLLRTERNYLNSLHQLLSSCPCPLPSDFPSISQQSNILTWPSNPPPSVMLTHLISLIRASTLLLSRIHEDPSVWGVSSAFVLAEGEITNAYCGWCSAVGGWYSDDNEGGEDSKRYSSEPASPRGWRKSITSLPSVSSSSSLTSPVFLTRRKTKAKQHILSVRELGILPVQRITRYVLLFRDLLSHTPSSSSSRASVEQAVQLATQIAEKCNRMQRNAAFMWQQ